MKLHMINFYNPDSKQIATNLTTALSHELEKVIEWLESFN